MERKDGAEAENSAVIRFAKFGRSPRDIFRARAVPRDPRPVVGTGPGRSEGSPQPSPGERLCAAWQGEELLHENKRVFVVRRPTGASFESGLSLFGSRRVRDRGFPVFSRQGAVSRRTTGAENVSGSIRGMIPRPSGAGPAVVRHISGGLSEGRLSAGGVGISGIRSAVPPRAAFGVRLCVRHSPGTKRGRRREGQSLDVPGRIAQQWACRSGGLFATRRRKKFRKSASFDFFAVTVWNSEKFDYLCTRNTDKGD